MIRLTLLPLVLDAPAAATEHGPCYGRHGNLKRKVNTTVAHRDHVHIGVTERGAAGRTSFWSRGR